MLDEVQKLMNAYVANNKQRAAVPYMEKSGRRWKAREDRERRENTRVQTDYAKKFFDQGMRHDGQYVFWKSSSGTSGDPGRTAAGLPESAGEQAFMHAFRHAGEGRNAGAWRLL